MLRQYETGTTDTVKVFSGLEVEHTPAFGKQTLFLATNELTFDQIQELAVKVNAEAIYYGANRTFMHNIGTQVAQMIETIVLLLVQINTHPPPSGREAVIKSAASAASPEGFQAVIKSAASAASLAAKKS